MNQDYNKKFRQNLRDDPKKYLAQLGYQVTDDQQYIVKTNTKKITYVVFNEKLNQQFNDDALDMLNAGVKASTAGTVGSAGSAGTLSTVGGTFGCASTAGSVGSLGSIG